MAKPAAASNSYDPELVKSLVNKIEGYVVDLNSERGKYMKACRSIRESISGVYQEAKARGIPKKELRIMIDTRAKLAAARATIEELERDQQETILMLAEAFGEAADLPLFKAAIEASENDD
ncbi:hypothetical protein BJ122_102231 [Rhodopseudomonas faecalis]|uniref:Uncharacterized protein n=1 Tax=Rhodopseudomonas faecalis TaxID=99655 RepID=A0A318TT32_9BRAD|nr:hypothetical protein [Rhodopseudomonas faecalis]PYF05005.1 hypothetical protein BJ122_102231 [Rhodopseudomonas faecalis]